MSAGAARHVFKVVTHAAWAEACRRGAFGGSADDLRDGFIHLSEAHQLAGTLARHFKGQTDLVVVKLESAALGSALRWEPARNGELFPHLYAPLPMMAARAVHALRLDATGTPVLPEEL